MKEKIDEITKKVEDMYKKYPYPSPSTDPSQTNELLNLLKIFELESSINLEGKNILDAGTGSVHRITNVAEFYKKSNFLGIDVSEKSLHIAKQLIKQKKITNLKLKNINLMNEFSKIGKFDIILCMGVLHHLSNPDTGLKNIKNVLEKDGIIFLYLYGKLGGHTRMLNKKLISTALKYAQARLSPPTFGQIAGEAALQTPKSYFDNVTAEYVQRRNIVIEGLNAIEGIKCPNPGGAFYAVAELPVDNAEEFCQWLLEEFEYNNQTVMLAPAAGFYATKGLGKKEVRIAYVLNKESLKEALVCLKQALLIYEGSSIRKKEITI